MAEANPYMTPDSAVDSAPGEFGDSPVFSFATRAGRLRYLARTMIMAICVYIALGIGAAVMFGSGDLETDPAQAMTASLGLGYVAVMIVSMFFGVMFSIQRLHDLDQTGWLSLLHLVPFVNVLFGLYLLFASGTDGENRFGPPPPPNTLGVKLGALILPLIFILGFIAALAIPAYQSYAIRAQEAQLEQR